MVKEKVATILVFIQGFILDNLDETIAALLRSTENLEHNEK